MHNYVIYGVPIAAFVFLFTFAAIDFYRQARSMADRGSETKEHSERIYKDFEMYLKVTLGLVAAFGYIRLDKYLDQQELARQALQVVGGISMMVMATFCIFVICHQGSKIRRWKVIEWQGMLFWQELWACFAMWLFSSGIWVAAYIW